MARFVALCEIGLPDPDAPEDQLIYQTGEPFDLDLEVEDRRLDAEGLVAKGAAMPFDEWKAQRDRQIIAERAAMEAESARLAAEAGVESAAASEPSGGETPEVESRTRPPRRSIASLIEQKRAGG